MVETKDKQKELHKGVPEPTLRRLPSYLFLLKKLREQGMMNVSAPFIGKKLKFDNTQVVKDLSYTGISGKPRVGYNIFELIQALEDYLGFNRPNEAFLIGAGKLGSALMAYQGVKNLGVKIIAGFDVNPEIIGKTIENVLVLSMDKLEDLAKRLHISIAILCVPEAAAQQVADQLVKCGIKAIWNLSPAYLEVPDDVIVQNTSMYSNVVILLKKLQQAKEKQ